MDNTHTCEICFRQQLEHDPWCEECQAFTWPPHCCSGCPCGLHPEKSGVYQARHATKLKGGEE